jgi:HEAT repeats
MKDELVKLLWATPISDNTKFKRVMTPEQWLARLRAIPNVGQLLVELLEEIDLETGFGMGSYIDTALEMLGYKGYAELYVIGPPTWRHPPHVDPRAIAAYQRALRSKDVVLRAAAAGALGELGDGSAVPLLEKIVVDETEDHNVRFGAAGSLVDLESRSSEPALRKMLLSASGHIRDSAREALERLGFSAPPEPEY